jgi:hypothetical protein
VVTGMIIDKKIFTGSNVTGVEHQNDEIIFLATIL